METAEKMAVRAWRRGTALRALQGKNNHGVVGIGLTGAIATNRKLLGEHRVFVAARTETELFTISVRFNKNEQGFSVLGRRLEGNLSDLFALNMILYSAGLEQVLFSCVGIESMDIEEGHGNYRLCPKSLPLVDPDTIRSNTVFFPNGSNAPLEVLNPETHIIFDGSFHPLHFGHEHIAWEAEERTGKIVVFAITDDHPDKGRVEKNELLGRVAQFRFLAPVMITEGLRLYCDKARVFQGFSFITGSDVLGRLLDPKYYDFSVAEMLQTLKDYRVHFFVTNRVGEAPSGLLLQEISSEYRSMFTELSARTSVSSTSLRGVF
jgi:hypothetical protein